MPFSGHHRLGYPVPVPGPGGLWGRGLLCGPSLGYPAEHPHSTPYHTSPGGLSQWGSYRSCHPLHPPSLSGNHSETLCLNVIPSPHYPLVLGLPWLQRHDPHVSWTSGRVVEWSPHCLAHCLRSSQPPGVPSPLSSPEPPDLSSVPAEYHDLGEVFSKSRALSLPPHRPYDCAISLLPGVNCPTSCFYTISQPERAAMENYIRESLAVGIIRTSSSSVGAGFFFVGKRDGGHWPYIDYRALNNITIKDKYPLPLINALFKPLQTAPVFTKLDLCNAYHLVWIREGDEWKMAFNTPLGHFEYLVMPFGSANAPAVFQVLVNNVLRDLLSRCAYVYIDDILIFSKDIQEHCMHVRTVLQWLWENRLFIKAEKCTFHASSVPFLGFIVERCQLRPNPRKIWAVVEWPQRFLGLRFLGFSNFYRRFIWGYSRVAGPLTVSPLTTFLKWPTPGCSINIYLSISLNTFQCCIYILPKVQPIVHAVGGGSSTLLLIG